NEWRDNRSGRFEFGDKRFANEATRPKSPQGRRRNEDYSNGDREFKQSADVRLDRNLDRNSYGERENQSFGETGSYLNSFDKRGNADPARYNRQEHDNGDHDRRVHDRRDHYGRIYDHRDHDRRSHDNRDHIRRESVSNQNRDRLMENHNGRGDESTGYNPSFPSFTPTSLAPVPVEMPVEERMAKAQNAQKLVNDMLLMAAQTGQLPIRPPGPPPPPPPPPPMPPMPSRPAPQFGVSDMGTRGGLNMLTQDRRSSDVMAPPPPANEPRLAQAFNGAHATVAGHSQFSALPAASSAVSVPPMFSEYRSDIIGGFLPSMAATQAPGTPALIQSRAPQPHPLAPVPPMPPVPPMHPLHSASQSSPMIPPYAPLNPIAVPSSVAQSEATKPSSESQLQLLLQLLTQVQEQSRAANAMGSTGGPNQALPTGVLSLVPHINQINQVFHQLQSSSQAQNAAPLTSDFGVRTPSSMTQLEPRVTSPLMSANPNAQILSPASSHQLTDRSRDLGRGHSMNTNNSQSVRPARAPLPPQHDTVLSVLDMSKEQRKYMTALEKRTNSESEGFYERGRSSSVMPMSDSREQFKGNQYQPRSGDDNDSDYYNKRVKTENQESGYSYSKPSGSGSGGRSFEYSGYNDSTMDGYGAVANSDRGSSSHDITATADHAMKEDHRRMRPMVGNPTPIVVEAEVEAVIHGGATAHGVVADTEEAITGMTIMKEATTINAEAPIPSKDP
ncbi:hypothetical protein BGZ94_001895, partial [Podila epigama]